MPSQTQYLPVNFNELEISPSLSSSHLVLPLTHGAPDPRCHPGADVDHEDVLPDVCSPLTWCLMLSVTV